jgi:hypothetical protein
MRIRSGSACAKPGFSWRSGREPADTRVFDTACFPQGGEVFLLKGLTMDKHDCISLRMIHTMTKTPSYPNDDSAHFTGKKAEVKQVKLFSPAESAQETDRYANGSYRCGKFRLGWDKRKIPVGMEVDIENRASIW